MKLFIFLLVLIGSLACTVPCHAGGYCAIAYSVHTGRYGYSDGYSSRALAETRALESCGVWDARIAGWGHNSYVALARGNGSAWGCGVASTLALAESRALHFCPPPNAHIVKWVYSFD